MQSRLCLVLTTLSLVVLPACGSDDDPAGPGSADTTAPAAVADLQVLNFDATQATIIWTAPGDDGANGTATQYQIGYATEPITPASWAGCTMLAACPTPTPAGSQQSAQIETPPMPDMYVALKAVDESGNWSALSNVAHGRIPQEFDVIQLTHEGSNRYPCLDDGFVTWVGWREGDSEIWIAGLGGVSATPNRLTDNGGDKMYPSSHGREKIVWMNKERDGDDWEICVYSYMKTPRYQAFTDNEVHDWFPELAGGGDFVWASGYTMFQEILYWNEAGHSQVNLTSECCPTDKYTNISVAAGDGMVVWQRTDRVGDDPTVTYKWEGGVRRDITEYVDRGAHDLSIDNGAIAFEWSSSPATIKYWDGATVRDIAQGYAPDLDDGWIAYEGWDGHDWEIYLWDGSVIEQITDNDFEDFYPSLSGDRLAWSGRPSGSGGAYQIFYTRLPER